MTPSVCYKNILNLENAVLILWMVLQGPKNTMKYKTSLGYSTFKIILYKSSSYRSI